MKGFNLAKIDDEGFPRGLVHRGGTRHSSPGKGSIKCKWQSLLTQQAIWRHLIEMGRRGIYCCIHLLGRSLSYLNHRHTSTRVAICRLLIFFLFLEFPVHNCDHEIQRQVQSRPDGQPWTGLNHLVHFSEPSSTSLSPVLQMRASQSHCVGVLVSKIRKNAFYYGVGSRLGRVTDWTLFRLASSNSVTFCNFYFLL